MKITWTRESTLQAVEIGVIGSWAGEWLLREQPVDFALNAELNKLFRAGEIRRDALGRALVVRIGGPQ